MRKHWDRWAIKAAIHRRGETLTGLARQAGIDPSACRVALLRRHEAGELAIAQFLGVHPWLLWPSRYAQPEAIRPPGRAASPKARAA